MDPIRTPLAAAHERRGARMVNFSGYWMPIQYTSILEEARHVRRRAGLFDLCHMGRVRLRGADAVAFADRLVTCDVATLAIGAIRYGLLTREDGTILDDVLVYREPDSVFVCINAGNRNRDLAWLRTHAAGTSVEVEDLSNDLAMIAIQGPESVAVVRALAGKDPGTLKYYRFFSAPFAGLEDVMISRTGYTGEDGFEFYFDAGRAEEVFERMLESGAPNGLAPIGLGARDTLRLEAGMPLYGHEIDDTTTPYEAGLMWAVKPSREFIGGAAITDLESAPPRRRLVGFTCADKRVPRQGYAILADDESVGDVRSGTFSPVLGTNIGTAYVAATALDAARPLHLDLRGQRAPIEITALPFYRRPR
jgi:aminomethyltransferase